MIRTVLQAVGIGSAVFMIIAILLQQRGSSLSGVFGGGEEIYRTKRGIEKILFYSTIVLATLFLGSAITTIIL